MTNQYPYDAWGVEMFAHNQWHLIAGEIHSTHGYAERGLRNLIDEGLSPKELRIVPLTITKRDTE